ncbi:MAG TPA: DNA translocase FtsK, partial [Polyangiales bacterium]|nr:DNA translocase FtsK [Polyangiales bacterium]
MDATAGQQGVLRGLGLLLLGALLVVVLLPVDGQNLFGLFGRTLSDVLRAAFGWGAWLLPYFALTFARANIFAGASSRPAHLLLQLGVVALICTTLHLMFGAGGRLGAVLGAPLMMLFGFGAHLACIATVIALVARWTRRSPLRAIGAFVWNSRRRLTAAWRTATARERTHFARELTMVGAAPLVAAQPALSPRSASAVVEVDADPSPIPPTSATAAEPVQAGTAGVDAAAGPTADVVPSVDPDEGARVDVLDRCGRDRETSPSPYRLPSAALLDMPAVSGRALDQEVLKATALKLQERLAGYGIEGQIDGLTPGPVVTMYEFEPKAGQKLARIRSLDAELSMVLEQGVRIIAPLPGTARVGIEVPHPDTDRELVWLRELVDDERWEMFDGKLPLALGKDSSGQPVYCDLAAAPHLLVAGATGAGKSIGLSAMLVSLVLRRTPDELRLLLIDPKVVELAGFGELPHLLAPVVTEMQQAVGAVQWAVGEMERRYRLFAGVGARHVDAYNARIEVTPLPSIVIVVDEFADLMMADSKERRVEAAIARLAQKARASGMHLIVATQRPSVDVITGLIKANLPSRIAFRVAQWVDSKVILDRKGAERLLGRGDMLCHLPGSLDLQRVHGAYVSEGDVKTVCDCARSQRAPEYDERILAALENGAIEPSDEQDGLYDRAVAFVAEAGACSTSALQREFKVG